MRRRSTKFQSIIAPSIAKLPERAPKGLLSPLQPWHSAQFHLFLGKQFEHPRTDQVLAGNLCVATARSM